MRKLFLLIMAVAMIFSCTQSKESTDGEKLGKYVLSYTKGELSRRGSIEVSFTQKVLDSYGSGDEIKDSVFSLSPGIKGKLVKRGMDTIVFTPENEFEQGKTYTYTVHLNKIFKNPEIKSFSAEVEISVLKLETFTLYPYSTGNKNMELRGFLTFSDVVDKELLEKAIRIDNKYSAIEWEHDEKHHRFFIKGITQQTDDIKYSISFDNSVLGLKESIKQDVNIPGIGRFEVTRQQYVRDERKLMVYFSNPIDTSQDIDSKIKVSGGTARTSINGNILSLFFSNVNTENRKVNVTIYKDLKSTYGTNLKKDYSTSISVGEIPKPEIDIKNTGGIVPDKGNAYIPFKAIGLRAVDVTVIEIFPHNMLEFYKRFTNIKSSGSRNIVYVGRPVAEFTVNLDRDDNDLYTWGEYRINLADYIDIDKQAIYRVEIDFNRKYFIGISKEEAATLQDKTYRRDYDTPPGRNSYYYYYDDYYERRDPYNVAYYRNGRQKDSTFIAVSNINLIAFQHNGSLSVIASDTTTGSPVSSAKIELFTLQGTKIAEKTTDNIGFASIETENTAAFVKASRGDDTAYLYLSPDNMTELSNFNVGGSVRGDELDAFIYGERDVWRPGDNVHIFLMLEDKKNSLPDDYPVVARFINPKGKVKQRIVKSEHVNRVYYFMFSTDPDDITGNWSVSFEVGGKTFTKSIAIETVKPNRMRTTLTFPDKIIRSGNSVDVGVEVKWLHGAPAQNTRVNISYSLFPVKTSFPNYEAYVFDNPTIKFRSSYSNAADFETDANGKGSFVFKPGKIYSPGMLNTVFLCRAYETGGDISINSTSIKYSPYTHYAGLMLTTEKSRWYDFESRKKYVMDLISVTDEGKPAAGRNLKVTIYRIDWWWWWHQDEDYTNFFREYNAKKINSWMVKTNNAGQAKQEFSFDDGGRYLIYVEDRESRHATGKIVYVSWWGRSGLNSTGDASVLFFFPDKDEYRPGDKAKFSFPASSGAKLYLAVSDAYSVKKSMYIEAKEGAETIDVSIDIAEDFDSTMYVHAFMVQPYDQFNNDRPIRMYGVQPIKIVKDKNILSPVIKTEDVFKPLNKAVIEVSERKGRPMTYSLAIVDEGLLDLTNFKTPDPYNYFYAKKALLLKIWDTYSYILSRSKLSIGKILKPGGGGFEEEEEGKKSANRFEPVVIVKGPFFLEPNKTNRHEIDIPQYIGSVRIMVVARDKNSYGSAEKAVQVKSSLMTLATAPRVARFGDSFSIPINITASDDAVGKAKVHIEIDGPIEITGENTKTFDIEKPGEYYTYFSAKAVKLGIAKITGYAESNGNRSDFSFEMDVLPPSALTTRVESATISGKSAASFDVKPIGITGGNTYKLELSIIPPINIESRLKYLISYPYGCAEQTTSKALPQIMLSDIVSLTEDKKSEIEDNVDVAIKKLTDMQASDGGFAYWPGLQSDDWVSSYAGHFLILARKKGYHVPSYVIDNWLTYQKKKAREWTYNTSWRYKNFAHAYRLYTLALAGSPDMSAMNRALEKIDKGDIRSRLRLAAAYALAGNKTTANGILSEITDIDAFIASEANNDDYWWYSYGSGLRNIAMALETYSLTGEMDRAFKLAKHIAEKLSSDNRMSTNTTAYCLYAMQQYLNASVTSEKIMAQYTWEGNPVDIVSDRPIQLITLPGEDGSKLTVRNKSDAPLYARVISSGYPPLIESRAVENLIKLKVEFFDKDSNPINPKNIKQGTDVIVKTTVTNPSSAKYRNIALAVIVPSGWEILNQRLFETAITRNQSSFTYQDIRDDRIYTFFDMEPKEKKTYTFLATAAYEGEFFFPPVLVEDMYNYEIRAESASFFAKVLKADK